MNEHMCPKCRHKFYTRTTQPPTFDNHRSVLPEHDPTFDVKRATQAARQALARPSDVPITENDTGATRMNDTKPPQRTEREWDQPSRGPQGVYATEADTRRDLDKAELEELRSE